MQYRYTYSINGNSSIRLSELVEILGITGKDQDYETGKDFVKDVENVTFSDESLLKIEKAGWFGTGIFSEDDWELTSLKPFKTEETLTIEMNNNVKYIIDVTDAITQDISSLLTKVDINATQNSDGSYTVYEGQSYGINLTFKENPNGLQFDMTNGFYYDLPSGIFDAEALSGKTLIKLAGGDHAGEEVELDYRLEGNRLIFSWPDQTSGAYQQLANALYTSFNIHIEGQFREDARELEFNDDITKIVDVKTDGSASVQKSGSYNPETNCIDYTVSVTSTGICKNVVVTDSISGSALTYNNDAIATSNKNSTTYRPTSSGNGFTFTIPQMGDGETVTVRYSAAVNLDALTRNPDGTLGTVTETGNKVTVAPSNHPGDEDETSGKDFTNKITYSTISKSSEVGETGEDGHATVTWTIKANANTNVSMAGHTISDLIDPGSQSIMKYNGPGITVVRKNSSGAVVSTQTIPWSSLTTHSDSSWTWTVPNSSPDTDKLSYEITYTTDVDVSGKLFNTTVKNTSTSDNGGSSESSGNVGPVGGPLIARKVYKSKNLTGEEKTVTWEINFDVPATGLDSAEIVDTLPEYWKNNESIFDAYKDGSITITPELAFGESYEVSTYTGSDNKEKLKITFYKTVNEQKVPGLSGTGSKRKIRVGFKTVLNEEWLEAAMTDPGAAIHTNNADVILNGQTLQTSANVKIDTTQPELSKTHNAEVVNVYNGNRLPAWQFLITLKGVSDEAFDENGEIVILDTYNSKYLDWYPHAYPDWEKQNGQVFGGTSNYKFVASSTDKVMTKVTDGQLKIVLKQSELPRDETGEYYELYTIPYYLTVKDPIALQKLITAATNTEGGAISLYNTASNEIFGDTEDKVEYEVPVVDKSATEPTLTNGIYKLHYTIDINRRALQLGDSEELVLTDEYSNISIDYTSLKIYEYSTNPWGQETRTEVNDVIWDRSGYTITYYLKNATHYQIEYDAHLSGEGEEIDPDHSKLTYTNTAEVFGKKSTWEKEKVIEKGGSGESRTFRIKVLKHEKGNASNGLEGAKFKLYWYPSTADDPDGMDSRPGINDSGWEDTGKTLTTDSRGYAQTTNDMGIHSQTWYKLVETEAPEGYTLKSTHYYFWITEGQVADYSKYVYINDDVLAINNTPELPETVDITVKKIWDDHDNDAGLRRDVTVHLYAEGQPYNEYYSGEWAADAREDADVVLHRKENGEWETYTWEGLPSGNTYSVVEDSVPGYTTIYSPKNRLTSGELNITNKHNPEKTAISVDKVWSGSAKPTEDITIQLKRNVIANADMIVARPDGYQITNYGVPAGSEVTFTYKYKNSWGYDCPELTIKNYKTGEILFHHGEISGSPTEHTASVTVPNDGILIIFESPYMASEAEFNNAFEFSFTAEGGTGTASEDVNFNSEHHYYTLNADKNWHLDIDNLVLSDADGAYKYYIEEVGVNDNTQTPEDAGYVVTYSDNNTEGITTGTITVTNGKDSTTAKFEKNWVNASDQGADVATIDNTRHLRILAQLKRGYISETSGEWVEIEDVGDPVILYGDTTTYRSKGYGDNYSETTNPAYGANWSAQWTDLEKTGTYNGETVTYVYHVEEKAVFADDSIDPDQNDMLKLNIYQNTVTYDDSTTTQTNTFQTTKLEVEKNWDPELTSEEESTAKVTVQLQRRARAVSQNYQYTNGIQPGEWLEWEDVSGSTIELNSSNSWKGSFSGLPKYGWLNDENTGNQFSFMEYDYQVVETGVTIDGLDVTPRYKPTVTITGNEGDKKVEITNKQDELTDFSFGKIWKDVNGNNAEWLDDKAVIVKVKRRVGDSVDESYSLTYNIEKTALTQGSTIVAEEEGAPNLVVETVDTSTFEYKFKVSGLTKEDDSGEYTYFVTESEKVPGYQDPKYAFENGTIKVDGADTDKALNEEYIVNVPEEAVSLPETGGPGPKVLYLLGLAIVLIAGTVFALRKKKLSTVRSSDNDGSFVRNYRGKRGGRR